jgi:hypothetical protein
MQICSLKHTAYHVDIVYVYITQIELNKHNEPKAKFSVMILNVICSNSFFFSYSRGYSLE